MSVVGLGLDLVDEARAAESLARFGARVVRRVCTDAEAAWIAAAAPARAAGRLAACLAAKEAAYKALGPAPGAALGWREIELGDGGTTLRVSGGAARAAAEAGVTTLRVSIAAAGGRVTALVTAERE